MDDLIELYHIKDFEKSLFYYYEGGEQPNFPDDYKMVATIKKSDVPDTLDVPGAQLEWIWKATNTVESVWFETFPGTVIGGSHRSTSVGDVAIIDGEPYVCLPMGWQKLSEFKPPVRR